MILTLKNINCGYNKNFNVLENINFSIKHGEILAIIGQNGSGKSTLARSIVNAVPNRTGEIDFEGNNISLFPTNKISVLGISYYMQGGQVFNNLSIKENLFFAGRKLKQELMRSRISFFQKHFTLFQNNRFNNMADSLSGGEKHQLALAMTLMQNPKLLILDEPSAGLSPSNTEVMYNLLNIIKQEYRLSILLIEQNIDKALEFSDRIGIIHMKELSIYDSNNKVNNIVSNIIFN